MASTATPEAGEELPGGDTSVWDQGRNAFSYPAANLSLDRQTPFFIGNSFFKKNWVEAPASTTGRDAKDARPGRVACNEGSEGTRVMRAQKASSRQWVSVA